MKNAARLLLPAIVLALAFPARGDSRAAAREHYFKGTKAFDLGAYDEAIAEYSAAYRAKEDPALLYNIAQAHRLAGHAAEALRFYKTYLARMTDPPNADEVRAKVAELQKTVDQEKKTQTSMPPDQTITPVPAETKPEAAKLDETKLPPVVAPAPVSVDRNAGRTKKIAGLAVGVLGLACVATGIAFGVLAQSLSDQATSLDRSMGTYDASKDQTGATDVILEGVFLGVGAAALVAGVTVLALGYREAKVARRASAQVTPMFSAHAGGLNLQVAF